MTVRQEVACRSYLPSRESVGVFSCKKNEFVANAT